MTRLWFFESAQDSEPFYLQISYGRIFFPDFDFAESRKMEKITLISVSVQTTDIQDILYPQYPFPLLTVKSEHFERKTPR